MATQNLPFSYPAGSTLTAKLFAAPAGVIDLSTVIDTGTPVEQLLPGAIPSGRYAMEYEDLAAGDYWQLILDDGDVAFSDFYYGVTAVTGEYLGKSEAALRDAVMLLGARGAPAYRDLGDTTPIRFVWPVADVALTAFRSLNGGAYAATSGAIAFVATEGSEHWYVLNYHADDRAVGAVRYRITDGETTHYMSLQVTNTNEAIEAALAGQEALLLTISGGTTTSLTIADPAADLAVPGAYTGCRLRLLDVSTGAVNFRWATVHTVSEGSAVLTPDQAFGFTPVAGDTLKLYQQQNWTANLASWRNTVPGNLDSNGFVPSNTAAINGNTAAVATFRQWLDNNRLDVVLSGIPLAVEQELLNDLTGEQFLAGINQKVQELFDASNDLPVATLVDLVSSAVISGLNDPDPETIATAVLQAFANVVSDTEVAAAVAVKLATMLEASGDIWRFTPDAVSSAGTPVEVAAQIEAAANAATAANAKLDATRLAKLDALPTAHSQRALP